MGQTVSEGKDRRLESLGRNTIEFVGKKICTNTGPKTSQDQDAIWKVYIKLQDLISPYFEI